MNSRDKLNHYQVLGVSETATLDEIKQQFRLLSLQCRLDKSEDVEKFREIYASYSKLRNVETRKNYDDQLKQDNAFKKFEKSYLTLFSAIQEVKINESNKTAFIGLLGAGMVLGSVIPAAFGYPSISNCLLVASLLADACFIYRAYNEYKEANQTRKLWQGFSIFAEKYVDSIKQARIELTPRLEWKKE